MSLETRVAQKDKLHALLLVKKVYEKGGMPILPELNILIVQAVSVMDADDVAYVEKQLKGDGE